MFWIITYSVEVAPQEVVAVLKKSTYLQEVADQKKYLLPRSSS